MCVSGRSGPAGKMPVLWFLSVTLVCPPFFCSSSLCFFCIHATSCTVFSPTVQLMCRSRQKHYHHTMCIRHLSYTAILLYSTISAEKPPSDHTACFPHCWPEIFGSFAMAFSSSASAGT